MTAVSDQEREWISISTRGVLSAAAAVPGVVLMELERSRRGPGGCVRAAVSIGGRHVSLTVSVDGCELGSDELATALVTRAIVERLSWMSARDLQPSGGE